MKKKAGKSKDMSIDDLAVMVAKGFNSVDERLNKVEENIKDLRKDMQATRRDVLNMGDKFVTYNKFDELVFRVTKLEKHKK